MKEFDFKRAAVAIIFTAALLLAWPTVVSVVGTWLGYDMSPQRQPQVTRNDPATNPTPAATQVSLPPNTTAPVVVVPQTGRTLRVEGGPAQQAATILGSIDPHDGTYAIGMYVSPIGAAIDGVTVNNSRKETGKPDLYQFQQPYPSYPVGTKPTAITALRIDGVSIDLAAVAWKLDEAASKPPASVTYYTDVVGPGGPVVTVRKSFAVQPKAEGGPKGPNGYETRIVFEFVNRTAAPLSLVADIAGPTLPPPEIDRGPDRSIIAGYYGNNVINFKHEGVEAFTEKFPAKHYDHNKDGEPVVWFGTASTYFNAIFRPELRAGETSPHWIRAINARAIDAKVDSFRKQVAVSIATTEITVPAGGTTALPIKAYFGPKLRALLKNEYYAQPALAYNESLTLSGGCTYCTFQPVIDALMWLLNLFHTVFRDWGVAIIALVVLVRGILHPVTKRSQISMSKMAKMGPEMERLKKKYGDDKEGLNRAMVDFYKTQGAAPILGCLPMFLQMPIWIALYSGLSGTFELRQEPFLYGLTWIKDLAKPDHLLELAPENQFNLLFIHVSGLNVLPFLLAIAFYMQMKLQPKPPAMTPEQAQQQKMMQWMTLLFPVMLYPGPSGLNIYILTSTIIGIIESKIIRKHINEREALEAAGPIIIDAPAPRGGSRRRDEPAKPAKSGGIAGWLANMQQKAEELQNEAEKRKKRRN